MLEATNPGHITGALSSCNALTRKLKPHYCQCWTLRQRGLTQQSRGNTKNGAQLIDHLIYLKCQLVIQQHSAAFKSHAV